MRVRRTYEGQNEVDMGGLKGTGGKSWEKGGYFGSLSSATSAWWNFEKNQTINGWSNRGPSMEVRRHRVIYFIKIMLRRQKRRGAGFSLPEGR